MAVTDTLLNTLFDGRYRIVRKLGTGGMANVYLAEDEVLGRRVAIKILNDRHAGDDQFVERFRREAKNAASLSHPNIVSIYDRGEAEGTYYIAMEYLDGRSLKELIVARGPAPIHLDVDLGGRRALAKDPSERYQSAEEMDADLRRINRGVAISPVTEEAATAIIARPPSAVTEIKQRPPRAPVPYAPPSAYYDYDEPPRRALWPWFVALLFVAAALVGGYFLYSQIQDQLSGSKTVAVGNYLGIH